MKKLISYFAIVVLTIGCFDNNVVGPDTYTKPIDLGTPSIMMNVVSSSGPIVSDSYTITMDVTQGSVYSLQLTRIDGTIVHNHPFTAQTNRVTVTLDYSTVTNGAYDLYLMNTSGQELKVPVIIQH